MLPKKYDPYHYSAQSAKSGKDFSTGTNYSKLIAKAKKW
jgi:hypothetical protein